ncbi:hypothetical protein O4J56_11590 [Nocardiopsis sp. RSe5-2]|uniref:Uncharacterized protein n=1 Tax=Nocardiopsis endophytica TaxID=3018445 RepID=A0ABT4U2X8_9ACTN|nr:hypothetical protein [Nocardiopsis endophytica]MDA2811275.1 hypothetical protein [Nocardiopsis endophytica]
MAVLLLVAGLVVTGLALGFMLAVSLGIRSRDRKGGYRSLRDDPDGGPLSASGRRVVGLAFRDAPRTPAHTP